MAAAVVARSEEHTSELQSHSEISYAVFCLKKKKPSRVMLEPRTMSNMLDVLNITGTELVLDIGAGYGYSSAVVARFFFKDTATTEIYTLSYTLSLHDALPIWLRGVRRVSGFASMFGAQFAHSAR